MSSETGRTSHLNDGYTFAEMVCDRNEYRVKRVKTLFELATGVSAHIVVDGGYSAIQFGTDDGYDFLSIRDATLLERADNDVRLPLVRKGCWSTLVKRAQWERETHMAARRHWQKSLAAEIADKIERGMGTLEEIPCHPDVHDIVKDILKKREALRAEDC